MDVGAIELLASRRNLPVSNMDDFNRQFPTYNLEEKVHLTIEGDIRSPMMLIYSRRVKWGVRCESLLGKN